MKKITPIRAPWMGTMTSRERFNRQMHFQPVDRCFNMECGYWSENFKQWDIFVDNQITDNTEAGEFFSLESLTGVSGNNFMSPPFEWQVVEDMEDTVILQTGDGIIAEYTKHRSSMPRFIKSAITTPDDWKRIKEERFRVDDPERILNVDELAAKHPRDRTYPLGIHCGSMIGRIRDMLTFEGVCFAWADYPDMLEDMVETCCLLVENTLDQVLGKIDFDYASGWEDICFKNGPILPPSFFRDVVGPRYRRISDKLHKHGIDLWYIDCDGDVRPILPYFLENGVNCLDPYEVNACAHPGELLDRYEDLRIMGGVDKMKLIEGPEATKAYLESLVPYVRRGGFIPFCDHGCPPDVTPYNYLYYLDLKEELFGKML